MAFRRGFKSQCERRSVEYRRRLGLKQDDPLSADCLARHLSVTVWSVADVVSLGVEDLAILSDEADGSWSALTMRIGMDNLVIYKPVSSEGRRNNVVMHELSHIVLGHDLADACIMDDGSLVPGNFNQDQEDEADWLAGTLLLPRPALISLRRRRIPDQAACRQYLVSQEMLTWRLRMTGVDFQLARSRY